MECSRERLKVKMLLLQHCALHKFHVMDCQDTRDQIMSDRKSKQYCLHTCDACVITTWRLWATRGARNNDNDIDNDDDDKDDKNNNNNR